MSYQLRINTLEESCRQLDQQIYNLEKNGGPDSEKILQLKNKKIELMNEVRRLTRLQWEEDYERVHFDDDR